MKLTRRLFGVTAFATALAISTAIPSFAEGNKLGVMIYNVGVDPWMNVAVKALEEHGKALGYEVTVADGKNDVAQMNAAIDQFVIQGVKAIVICPADPDSLVGSVSKAVSAGVPVVAFSLGVSKDANLTSFIGADEVGMGRTGAQLALQAIKGKGNVALMTGILGTSAQIGRSQGQHEVFDKEAGIKVVEEQPNDWAHDKTVALIQDWLSKYPKGELNAVLAHGPELVAAAEYAKSQGRDEVVFVGIDYPEDARRAIKEGTLLGTISQDPKMLAKLAVETADKAAKGESVEKVVMIETTTITKENVDQKAADY
jgi:ABC-type sugar transport system substrate-binding protein